MSTSLIFSPSIHTVSPSTTQLIPPPVWQRPKCGERGARGLLVARGAIEAAGALPRLKVAASIIVALFAAHAIAVPVQMRPIAGIATPYRSGPSSACSGAIPKRPAPAR